MPLTQEELNEIRYAVNYYQQYNISVNSPRYKEYSLIINKLSELLKLEKIK